MSLDQEHHYGTLIHSITRSTLFQVLSDVRGDDYIQRQSNHDYSAGTRTRLEAPPTWTRRPFTSPSRRHHWIDNPSRGRPERVDASGTKPTCSRKLYCQCDQSLLSSGCDQIGRASCRERV